MPVDNCFRHQVYAEARPTAKYTLLGPCLTATAAADEPLAWQQAWHQAGVHAVYLVHGTFRGDDALGIVRGLQRFAPSWGQAARDIGKSLIDLWTGDTGNYSKSYRQELQDMLGNEQQIPVRRFLWSGENNHVGRAEAAIELLDQLLSRAKQGEQEIVMWGHSHAGNVFALITNLVGGDENAIHQFFRSTRSMRRAVCGEHSSQATVWRRVRRQLLDQIPRQTNLRLHLVTFGTPIRYGWETRGYEQLLHFVHHRPAAGLPEWRTAFPFSLEDLLEVRNGDYIQQLGISGTDFLPPLLSYRRWRTEFRLARLLERHLRRRAVLDRLRMGVRVAGEGHTLLVDYPDDAKHAREQLLGHGIYTKLDWLGFHLREVTRRLFNSDVESPDVNAPDVDATAFQRDP